MSFSSYTGRHWRGAVMCIVMRIACIILLLGGAVLITVALSALTAISVVSLIALAAAVLAALDARHIGIWWYRSDIAAEAGTLFILLVLLWPIVFPWYWAAYEDLDWQAELKDEYRLLPARLLPQRMRRSHVGFDRGTSAAHR